MRAFRVAYDGTYYRGFQRQPHSGTVEDELFRALPPDPLLLRRVEYDVDFAGDDKSGVPLTTELPAQPPDGADGDHPAVVEALQVPFRNRVHLLLACHLPGRPSPVAGRP